jgi:SH3-like domain-containing protein
MRKRVIAEGEERPARQGGAARAVPGIAAVAAIALGALGAAGALAADLRSVSERAAVLYDAPSARAKKLYVVGQHYPLEVVVNLDAWVKVRDVSGEMTWIEKKALSERRTLIVTVAMADVRQAADEKSALVFQAREGVILELAEIGASGWVRVQHRDGQGGYIRGNQVWGL